MSTHYMAALTATPQKLTTVLDSYLQSCKRFNAFDILGGNRYTNNFQKLSLSDPKELDKVRVLFVEQFNVCLASSYTESSQDIPKNIAYHQNLADLNNISVAANGSVDNIRSICGITGISEGQSLPEFIKNYYVYLNGHKLKDQLIQNMVKELDSDCLSFIIMDRVNDVIYFYNRGDQVYLRNASGSDIIISSRPLNSQSYPNDGFHLLPSNCAFKITIKSMYMDAIPVNPNTYNAGKDIMIDKQKAILFTEMPNSEYYTTSFLFKNNMKIYNLTDVVPVYFGFDTSVDKLVLEKYNNIKNELKIAKSVVHIPYTFTNIYASESEIIELQSVSNGDSQESNYTKISHKETASIASRNFFIANKLNFIATSLINYAIKTGIGTIIIPNVDRSDSRLITIMKALLSAQIYSNIRIITLYDEFSLTDIIRYLYICKEYNDISRSILDCSRTDLELTSSNSFGVNVNASSKTCSNIICAFQKVGVESAFIDEAYTGSYNPSAAFLEANLSSERPATSQAKINFMDNFAKILEAHIASQK